MRQSPPSLYKKAIFWGVVAVASIFYGIAQIQKASSKPFWLDEEVSLRQFIRTIPIKRMIVGVSGQGSPSPLEYILVKCLDNIRKPARYLFLHPLAYYRLVSLMATMMSAWIVLWLFYRRFHLSGQGNLWAGGILMSAVVCYVLQTEVYHFTAEMRPYALWVGLSFVVYGGLLAGAHQKWVSAAMLALAATATASIFQIFTLAMAYLLTGWNRETVRKTLVFFSLPFLLSLFYCLQVGQSGYVGDEYGTWQQFMSFWLRKEHVYVWLLSGAAVAFCALKKETRGLAAPTLSMLLLYMMGPLIYYITRHKGFFFSSRQYIYYDLAVPLFILTVAMCLMRWFADDRWRRRALAAFCLFSIILSGVYLRKPLRTVERDWQSGRRNVLPMDSDGAYTRLIISELPKGFCVKAPASYSLLRNVELLAEWLPVRYGRLPVGSQTVLLVGEGGNARVVEVRSGKRLCEHYVEVSRPGVAK